MAQLMREKLEEIQEESSIPKWSKALQFVQHIPQLRAAQPLLTADVRKHQISVQPRDKNE